MNRLRAFFLGVREFRCDLTTSYDDPALCEAYDAGREAAHRVTRRRYDHNHHTNQERS